MIPEQSRRPDSLRDPRQGDIALVKSGAVSATDAVFRQIVENAVDYIVRTDASGNRCYVSPSSRELLGFEPAEMIGKHAFELIHPDDLPSAMQKAARFGPLHPRQDLTFRMRRADGSYIWVGATYRYLPDGGALAILRDVTAEKLAELRLADANAKLEAANAKLEAVNATLHGLALVDGLTGLANRRHFDQLLDEEFQRARRLELPLGLVLLDIDHFKAFNDHYGHLGGDDCLRRIARCVSDAGLRPGDHAARYGGEEITVVLPGADSIGCADAAERMRDAVAKLRIEHAGSSRQIVTVSAGAASIDACRLGADQAGLIKAADEALYQAKASGRNCVRYRPDGMAAVN